MTSSAARRRRAAPSAYAITNARTSAAPRGVPPRSSAAHRGPDGIIAAVGHQSRRPRPESSTQWPHGPIPESSPFERGIPRHGPAEPRLALHGGSAEMPPSPPLRAGQTEQPSVPELAHPPASRPNPERSSRSARDSGFETAHTDGITTALTAREPGLMGQSAPHLAGDRQQEILVR